MSSRPLLLIVAAAALFLCSVVRAGAQTSPGKWGGVAIGFPQAVAMVAQGRVVTPVWLELDVGTIIVLSTAAARVLFIPDANKLRPYGFIGAGISYSTTDDVGFQRGWYTFSWVGLGGRGPLGRGEWFAEIGLVTRMDSTRGFDENAPALSVGYLLPR